MPKAIRLPPQAKGSLVKDDHVAKVQRMRKSGQRPLPRGVEPERIVRVDRGYANRLLPVPWYVVGKC